MIHRFFFCLLLLAAVPLNSQDIPLPGESTFSGESSSGTAPEVFGYVENTLNSEHRVQDDSVTFLNNTRARVTMEGKPNNSMDYAISLTGNLYSGNTEFTLLDYFPEDQKAEASYTDIYTYAYSNEIVIQEAFASLYLDSLMVRVGRQKYYTGTGYAYNPSDLFNSKNPLDPTYEFDGIDALLVSFSIMDNYSLDLLARVGAEADEFDYHCYVGGYIGSWSYGLQYTSVFVERRDYSAINDVNVETAIMSGNQAILDLDNYRNYTRWHYVGADFSGELDQVHIYGEGGYIIVSPDERSGSHNLMDNNHERILVGVDYTFTSQLYIVMEYLRYGIGDENADDISFIDRMEYYSGDRLSLARNTLFTGVSYPVTDLSELGVYHISEIDVQGFVINPQYTIDIVQDVTLLVNIQIPYGSENALGNTGSAGFVRLKVNF